MDRCLAACLRCAWVLCACLPLAAQAALYRCPSPFGEGTVVTNLMSDAEAKERSCEPLQSRRSTLDGPAREEPPQKQRASVSSSSRRSSSERSAAERISDEWMSGGSKGAAPREGARASVAPPAADSRAAPDRKVAADIQRERDSDRKLILESELQREQQAMAKTLQQAKSAPAGGEDKQRLDEAIARHVANVEALKRELSRIR